jgi:beta-lactamase class A
VGLCLVALAVLVVAIQLFYPTSRVLPLVRVGDQRVGGSSRDEVSRQVDDLYRGATIDAVTAAKHFKQPLQDVGVAVNADETAKSAANYPFWQRLIPFSSVFVMLHRNTAPIVTLDESKLRNFADKIAKEGNIASVDATIVSENGKAKLIASKPSQSYPASQTVEILQIAHYTPQTVVELRPKTKEANRSDAEVRKHIDEAQRAIDTPLTLTFEGESAKPDKKTIGSWLKFTEVAPAYELKIELKPDDVAKYLVSVESKIYKAPGVTKIHTIDDKETDREVGVSGHGIIISRAISAIDAAIQKGNKATLALDTGKLEPAEEYNRQTSNTDQKLVALLNTVIASHPGYGISMIKIDGPSVNVNGTKQFESASTYKLYVAYSVLKAIENGQMSWSDNVAGRTAEKCLEDMIVVSDNDCPVAFKTKLGGWSVIENQAHAIGISSRTSLTGPTLLTTANDLSFFLYRLQKGALLNSSDTDRLLGLMKRQKYRDGIPAGTGLPVADKVGFVDDVIHDAGIVYSPKGTYVLVIMTTSTWSGIASAAKTINAGL